MRNLKKGMIPFMERMCKHLVLQRVWHNKTQSDVGNVVGCTFQQIQKWEKGINRITIDQVCYLYKQMGWNIISIIRDPQELLDFYVNRDRTSTDHIDDHLVEKSDFIKRKWLKVSTPVAATLTKQNEERI